MNNGNGVSDISYVPLVGGAKHAGFGGEHSQQFQTFQGMTHKTLASGAIHAPRNSFNKRSFGRDLSNLQAVDTNAESSKPTIANFTKKVIYSSSKSH